MFILSQMKERTKKIAAVKSAAETRSDSTEIYRTRSQGHSSRINFGRFACAHFRGAVLFKAEGEVQPVCRRMQEHYPSVAVGAA